MKTQLKLNRKQAIRFIDKIYTSDVCFRNYFRHWYYSAYNKDFIYMSTSFDTFSDYELNFIISLI